MDKNYVLSLTYSELFQWLLDQQYFQYKENEETNKSFIDNDQVYTEEIFVCCIARYFIFLSFIGNNKKVCPPSYLQVISLKVCLILTSVRSAL